MKYSIILLLIMFSMGAQAQLCGNQNACNYNPGDSEQETDDCIYPDNCSDPAAINYNAVSDCADDSKCLFLDECGFTVNQNGEPAGFVGDFTPENWIVNSGLGAGSGHVNEVLLTLYPDTTLTDETQLYMTWMGEGGTLTFDFEYTRTNMSLITPAYPQYAENGITYDLPFSATYGLRKGTVSVEIDPFGIFGFVLPAEYDVICDGPLLVYNLRFESDGCVPGCTYPQAENYDSLATLDDGSCLVTPSSCVGDMDGDQGIDSADLLIFLSVFSTDCE